MRIFDSLVKCALTFSFVFLQKITISATNSTVCKRYRTQPYAMSLFFVLCCLCICVCKNQGLLQRGGRSKQGNREPVPSPPPFFHPHLLASTKIKASIPTNLRECWQSRTETTNIAKNQRWSFLGDKKCLYFFLFLQHSSLSFDRIKKKNLSSVGSTIKGLKIQPLVGSMDPTAELYWFLGICL